MVAADETRYVAFLRAINVGGRRVAMVRLREVFEEMGLGGVETFIASGNVVFSSAEDPGALERRIEAGLEWALGFGVATFVRSTGEVAAVAALRPFGPSEPAGDRTLFVAFLAGTPDDAARERLLALQSETDALFVEGREAYWLRRGGSGDSSLSGAALDRALGMPATVRGISTVRRISAKYPPGPAKA